MQLTFHQDPGHGWVEVPRVLVDSLGIASQVSAYSYQKGGTCYLEEDCDAGLLVNALRAKNAEFKLVEAHTNFESFIRGLPRFRL